MLQLSKGVMSVAPAHLVGWGSAKAQESQAIQRPILHYLPALHDLQRVLHPAQHPRFSVIRSWPGHVRVESLVNGQQPDLKTAAAAQYDSAGSREAGPE